VDHEVRPQQPRWRRQHSGHPEELLGDERIRFRGRENSHPERGRALLKRVAEDLGELATVEQEPMQEGRNMHMLVGPTRAATADQPENGDKAEGGEKADE